MNARRDRERPPLFVAGLGESGPNRDDPRSIPEMVLEAVEGALGDASISHDDVDAIVTSSVDLYDGLTASSIAVTEVVGAVMKPETRIASDGLSALVHAACQLWAGAYRCVLVVAHGKASMAPQRAIERWAMDPIHLQPLGVDFRICAGLVAQQLASGDALERWARTACERRGAAGARGVAPACSAEQVLGSPLAAAPLTEEMCAPEADAACAVVLRSEGPGIALTGVGHDLAPHGLGLRDLTRWEGLRRAFERACAAASLERPAFDLLEPSCLYPHEEELFIDAIGATPDASFSPTGGLFAGAAPVAAGLSRLIAAARRMREQPELTSALAHGAWGPAAQGHAVAILEASP